MYNYFYFAEIRFEEVRSTGAARPKFVPVTYYGRSVYSNAALAVIANIGWICKHVGKRFTVCGFDRQLDLVDGKCVGWREVDDQDVISLDLKGAIALLKKNLKLCNVSL